MSRKKELARLEAEKEFIKEVQECIIQAYDNEEITVNCIEEFMRQCDDIFTGIIKSEKALSEANIWKRIFEIGKRRKIRLNIKKDKMLITNLLIALIKCLYARTVQINKHVVELDASHVLLQENVYFLRKFDLLATTIKNQKTSDGILYKNLDYTGKIIYLVRDYSNSFLVIPEKIKEEEKETHILNSLDDLSLEKKGKSTFDFDCFIKGLLNKPKYIDIFFEGYKDIDINNPIFDFFAEMKDYSLQENGLLQKINIPKQIKKKYGDLFETKDLYDTIEKMIDIRQHMLELVAEKHKFLKVFLDQKSEASESV